MSSTRLQYIEVGLEEVWPRLLEGLERSTTAGLEIERGRGGGREEEKICISNYMVTFAMYMYI